MPSAWIVTHTRPEWIEFFHAAGWEVKVFGPPDLAPASPTPGPDPDVIIFDAADRPLSDTFREICREKFCPLLAITADWELAGIGVSGLVGCVAALYPALVAAHVLPAEAVWYERRAFVAEGYRLTDKVMTDPLVLSACLSLSALFLLLMRLFLFLVRVDGWSMAPTFQDGDLLLALRHWPAHLLRRGQIVVWQPLEEGPLVPRSSQFPRPGYFIKRITGLPGDDVPVHSPGAPSHIERNPNGESVLRVWHVPPGHCFVQGDSPGYDSSVIGPIPMDYVRGVVILKIRRKTVSSMPATDLAEVRMHMDRPGDS